MTEDIPSILLDLIKVDTGVYNEHMSSSFPTRNGMLHAYLDGNGSVIAVAKIGKAGVIEGYFLPKDSVPRKD